MSVATKLAPPALSRRLAACAGATAILLVVAAAPASAAKAPPTLAFSGYTWQVKSSSGPVGPGPCTFSPTGPYVDGSGHLHLRISQRHSGWTCSEVILDHTLGYGTYQWTVQGDIANLDPNVTLGMFTWDDSTTSPTNREIDVEAARWGNASDPTNADYVVQPATTAGNELRLTIPAAVSETLRFTWTPGQVAFSGEATSSTGAVSSLPSWTNTSSDVPTSSTERVHMNLWLYQGQPPTNGQALDVTMSGFSFTPAG